MKSLFVLSCLIFVSLSVFAAAESTTEALKSTTEASKSTTEVPKLKTAPLKSKTVHSKLRIDNEIKEVFTTWNFEALNITLKACENYLNFLKEKDLLYSNLTFHLAIQIKEAMVELENIKDHKSYPKLFEEFTSLIHELPLCVVTLIWNSKTHLLNKYFPNEYLYVVYDDEADEDKRKLFTWVEGGRDPVGIWEFSTDDDGATFLIQNVEYKEYFYAGDNSLAHDKSRRNVFTWRKESTEEHIWTVEIQGEDEIMLKSKDRGEYLYAGYGSFSDGKRRKVFNWRETSACDDTCVWVMSPEKGSIVSEFDEDES